jgi:thioredoxin 1
MESENTVLMKFSATWCKPCKQLESVLDKLDIPFEIQVFDVDENSEVFREHNVRSVPALILMKDGEEYKRNTGVLSEAALKMFLEI